MTQGTFQGIAADRELAELIDASVRRAFKSDEFRDSVRGVIRTEFEGIGINSTDAPARIELQQDHRFIRRLRLALDGTASRIGWAILMAALAVIGGILWAGWQVKVGK